MDSGGHCHSRVSLWDANLTRHHKVQITKINEETCKNGRFIIKIVVGFTCKPGGAPEILRYSMILDDMITITSGSAGKLDVLLLISDPRLVCVAFRTIFTETCFSVRTWNVIGSSHEIKCTEIAQLTSHGNKISQKVCTGQYIRDKSYSKPSISA